MKQLRETLVVTDGRVLKLERFPTKQGVTCVLRIKGPLNPDLADTLRCRNQAFTLNDTPYPSLSSFTLDHEISSCELSVPGHERIQPTIVTGFKIVPSDAAEADGALEVHFRMKFLGMAKELNALCDSVENRPFDLALISLQESLFDPQPTGDGPEGGSRIDMGFQEGDDEPDGDDEPGEHEEPGEYVELPAVKKPRAGRGKVTRMAG